MMLNRACLSFAFSTAFIEPGARAQGSPVTVCLALLSYSQGLAGVGWRLNLRGPVLHRALVDIQQLLSVRRTATELWPSLWLHIRFTEQPFFIQWLKKIIGSILLRCCGSRMWQVYHLLLCGKKVSEHYS